MTSRPESRAGVPSRASACRSRMLAGIPAGALATLTMDLAMLGAGALAGRALHSDRLEPGIIGRWAAGLLHGRWSHRDITREDAIPGELALGIATHYGTGILLTEGWLLARRGSMPTVATSTAYGIATSVLPLLVLFPSLGYGPFGLRSGEAARIDGMMLLGHVAFGLGIGVWTRFLVHRRGS